LSFHTFQTYLPGGGIIRETQELQQGSPPMILRALDLYHLSSFYHTFDFLHGYLLGIFSLSFPYFFNLQTFRNWPRKLLFPPINPTFNAFVHWEIQILPT